MESKTSAESNPITDDKERPLKPKNDKSMNAPVGKGSQSRQLSLPAAASPVTKPAAKSKSLQITFDDDDDADLLSGLGFDDNDKKEKPAKPAAQKKQGTSGLASKEPPSSSTASRKQGAGGLGGKKLDDSFAAEVGGEGDTEEPVQFGGYVPSVADSSRPKSVLGRKRRADSEFITTRPSTAPSPAKKTVRFSEDLEQSLAERPLKKSSDVEKKGDNEELLPSQKHKESASASSTPQSEDKKAPSKTRHTSLQPSPSSPDSYMLQEAEPRETLHETSQDTGEGPALEHPLFPWQRPKDSTSSSSLPKRPRDRQIPHEARNHREHDQTDPGLGFEVDTKELKAAQQKINELQSAMEKEKNQLKVRCLPH